MDMVSFGPTMTGVHSPDEKLEVATVPKFYEYLLGILKKVSEVNTPHQISRTCTPAASS